MQIVGMPIVASGTSSARLDDPQQLEEEEEVPLGPRHVGRRRRVGLRAELGAEDQRHQDDDHDRRSAAMTESLATAYGKNGFPCAFRIEYSRRYCSFSRRFTRSSFRSSSGSSAFSHGGAVVPSLATRYRCAPISAAIGARARAACGSRRSATASSR